MASSFLIGVKQWTQNLLAFNNSTLGLVPLTYGKNVVGSKWVLKIKRDSNDNIAGYKKRLVAKGYL